MPDIDTTAARRKFSSADNAPEAVGSLDPTAVWTQADTRRLEPARPSQLGPRILRSPATRPALFACCFWASLLLSSIWHGCNTPAEESPSRPDASNQLDPQSCATVPITADEIFLDETLVDWVSFADHIARVEVTSEALIARPDSVIDNGEGYVGRRLRLRVHGTLWSNPFASALPDEIEFNGFGWLQRASCAELVPVHSGHGHAAPRLEVGGRYIIALVLYTQSAQGWGPLSSGSAWADGADPIASADIAATGINAVAQSLAAMTPAHVRSTLDGTTPYPAVADNLHLPAEERLALAQSAIE